MKDESSFLYRKLLYYMPKVGITEIGSLVYKKWIIKTLNICETVKDCLSFKKEKASLRPG